MNIHAGKGLFLANLVALALGATLFAGAFPNPVFENGSPFLAWIAYVPVFWLISRTTVAGSVLWGAVYGYASYGLFNYWLSAFHPLAGVIVNIIYLVYLAILFLFLKMAVTLFPKRGYILQWLLWLCFEYFRTQGFLGYAYGVTGYSQWQLPPVIQIADIFGVWGVSALVVFPSAWLASALDSKPVAQQQAAKDAILYRKARFKPDIIPLCVWALCLSAALVYGFVAQKDYAVEKNARIALIQHNTDPWLGGIVEYRRNFDKLTRLSDEALREKPDLVVWSETAFVPRIFWHQTYRDDEASWLLVKDLLDYLGRQTTPFMIGNDDGRREPDKNPNADEKYRVDYNAAILFEKGAIVQQYRKNHLVPFTEHFPYKKQLPFFYTLLKDADTHFWEKGAEWTVFDINGLKFSTPICFEDTFGYLSRNFAQNGAELIVNLTNDAWSKSLSAQMQHLGMAVFRAVETRRSLVRATSSGQTCAIDPNGAILAMAEPFTETQLTVTVPIMRETSRYVRYGDFLPFVCMIAAVAFIIVGLIMKKAGKNPSTS
ncbi:MAG: apolipoprotein N-acyltransferase [Treponema sp.]|jgi:apolipoprotein N-acyltransferase|nr:apolipoprotein N-acyltransferase [Treponema sp.]